jgi:hypothetical protein
MNIAQMMLTELTLVKKEVLVDEDLEELGLLGLTFKRGSFPSITVQTNVAGMHKESFKIGESYAVKDIFALAA